MAKLDFHIVARGNPLRTCTMTRKEKDNEKVVFHNDSAAVLTITVDRLDVLSDASGNLLTSNTFQVAAGGHKTFKIHDDCPPATELKYTATVSGAMPEDPIIIIER
ncbi:MAG: hypothetical protein WBO00_04765 [Steroidobacteraceae bacterium]